MTHFIEQDIHGITKNSPVTPIAYHVRPNAWRVMLANGVHVWAADECLHPMNAKDKP